MTPERRTIEQPSLDHLLRKALKSQYGAALAMLHQAVEQCPDSLWIRGSPPFWRVAYHAAFFADYYMRANESAFCPWEHHRPAIEALDEPPMGDPYTRTDILGYLSRCGAMVDSAVDALDLAAPDSGFSWYKVSKVEHQIINIRHIQHHAVYLSAALRGAGEKPVTWISPAQSEDRAS